MLTILLLIESVEACATLFVEEPVFEAWSGVIRISAALGALLVAPWALMIAIGARPLHSGGLRDMIITTLQDAGVRTRNVMLWPTGGSMVNGAVIGLLPALRYVLLTDELLERLPSGQIRAVVAHEAAMKAQAKKMNVDSLKSNQKDNEASAEVKIAKVAITNVLLWIVTWTPYAIVAMIGVFGNQMLITPLVAQLPSFLGKKELFAELQKCTYNYTDTKILNNLTPKLGTQGLF